MSEIGLPVREWEVEEPSRVEDSPRPEQEQDEELNPDVERLIREVEEVPHV